jgi:hypothetical protein
MTAKNAAAASSFKSSNSSNRRQSRLWIVFCVLLCSGLCCRRIHGFTLQKMVWFRKNSGDHQQKQQQHALSRRQQQPSLLSSSPTKIVQMATNTDISICIPPFYDDPAKNDDDDELQECPYPSPLHNIHIQSLLTEEQAATSLALARQYAASTGRWEQPDADRHASYATCDFPVEQADKLNDYLQNVVHFNERIWEQLTRLYGGEAGGGLQYEDLDYLDFFCVNYKARQLSNNDSTTDSSSLSMDRLELHRDGSLLSFSITLTPTSEFKGGGTTFDALSDRNSAIQYRDSRETTTNTFFNKDEAASVLIWNEHGQGVIRPTRAGDAVFHSGKLLHGADVVTAGERTVLVGFVDVADWCRRPGALTAACRDWGRMDVARKRWERQAEKTHSSSADHHPHHETTSTTATGKSSPSKTRGWIINNDKWLPKQNKSHLSGFCPAFSSVVRRADPEYQRRQRLKAEDLLLRRILLDPSEQQQVMEDEDTLVLDGDVTIL